MDLAMSGAEHDGTEGNLGENRDRSTRPAARTDRSLHVALGRRVEVIGDLLLPPVPSDCSRATSRDIAQRLEEWQGPGIVIMCGRLVAPSCQQAAGPAAALEAHRELVDALGAFAKRPDSQVIAVVAPAEHDPDLARALIRRGVRVCDGVDLHCETGAGLRTVLVRSGCLHRDSNLPFDATPTEDRPWLAGMERLDDPIAHPHPATGQRARQLRVVLSGSDDGDDL